MPAGDTVKGIHFERPERRFERHVEQLRRAGMAGGHDGSQQVCYVGRVESSHVGSAQRREDVAPEEVGIGFHRARLQG